MTIAMNMRDAKTNLSKLVAAALEGKEVILANRGVAMVRLVPYEHSPKRELGIVGDPKSWDNAFFDSLSDEELALWAL